MPSLQILAGPRARLHLAAHGLRPVDVRAVAAAAGGPKGLVLTPIDRFLFGQWLRGDGPPVHLVGASIGAWRMACAALPDPDAALARLARDYSTERYDPPPGERQSPRNVSQRFAALLDAQLAGRHAEVLAHPRLRLHVVTSRGRHWLLRRERPWATGLGYAGAFLGNLCSRRRLGGWLERVVFSDVREALPLPLDDLPTRHVPLTPDNLLPSILGSGSIPFWLDAVHDIPGAPRGAYWDGGITDYHLHWPWREIAATPESGGLVLYPHFQPRLVPGWLDKGLRHRHRPTPWLDNLIVLAPDPAWAATLPGGKLPDRSDFKAWGKDHAGRARAWTTAVAESQRLADELAQWLQDGCPLGRVTPLEST
ncbi:phospholipase [Sphaerotilus sp.]|uniref:phospholipase n=1 Tax=Sphaerotilus sp. TaxID=2093942 RepID=UPI0025FF6F11|nr:phospholipase [Sphaerotilus sp.]